MFTETDLDELWVAEKFQSKREIAGSPRNSFRASLNYRISGGRALNRCGSFAGYQILSNSEYHIILIGSQTTGDKVRCRKGKSPDLHLRSQS